MTFIKLRQDGWFEAGKNSKYSFPDAHIIYQSKQKLKKALEKIGEKPSIKKLEDGLLKISEVKHFRRTPYLRGNDLIIDISGPPGECYLGEIKE